MDGSFVNALISHLKPEFREANGLLYCNKEMFPIKRPEPEPIKIHSLRGLIEYCAEFLMHDVHSEALGVDQNFLAVVEGPEQVRLLSPLNTTTRQRETIVDVHRQRTSYPFGRRLSIESFIIAMQSQFIQDETTAAILKMFGRIKAGTEQMTEDDGVTQSVTVRKGIAKEGWEQVPNPVTLRPYRTFPEVKQPESQFVLRAYTSDGLEAALYEADGGAWQEEATKNIQAYLLEQMSHRDVQLNNIIVVE